MKFDYNYKPSRENLSAIVAKQMDELFYARRDAGLNVQFIRDDGRTDEWALKDMAQVNALVARFQASGVEYAVSAQ